MVKEKTANRFIAIFLSSVIGNVFTLLAVYLCFKLFVTIFGSKVNTLVEFVVVITVFGIGISVFNFVYDFVYKRVSGATLNVASNDINKTRESLVPATKISKMPEDRRYKQVNPVSKNKIMRLCPPKTHRVQMCHK